MKSFNLPRIALALAAGLLASLFLTLATRSIWVDEAMLLKDIIELHTPAEFFKPLPFTIKPSRWSRHCSSKGR